MPTIKVLQKIELLSLTNKKLEKKPSIFKFDNKKNTQINIKTV